MTSETIQKTKENEIKAWVKERYTQVLTEPRSTCCGATAENSCSTAMTNNAKMVQTIGYTAEELKVVPQDAAANSFGCGNPLAFAGVRSGQTVLDIGSGVGIDCFIASEKVGPSGRVIGVDMTPAMLERARANARKADITNVEFLQGEADALPVGDHSVDWVISNCVINLAPDKAKVFREIARVLKPGGQISVADIVIGNLPWWVRRSKFFYSSCVAGALHEPDYLAAIRAAGLEDIQIVSRFSYDESAISGFASSETAGSQTKWFAGKGIVSRFESWILPKLLGWFSKPVARRLAGQIVSIKVSARKPEVGS